MTISLDGAVAVVGIGESDFGQLYRDRSTPRSAASLGAAALAEALADAHLYKDDLDGLSVMRIESYQRFAGSIGMKPGQLRYVQGYPSSGRFSAIAMQEAVMAIACGQAETVACVYGNDGRSAGASYGGDTGGKNSPNYEALYGMTSPGAAVALTYSRYADRYGVPDGALAPVAISNRAYAANNPIAVMRKPLSVEDYLDARFIAEPLRLFDYCVVNDGGVAVILTTPERARALGRPMVLVRGMALAADLADVYQSQDEFYTACQAAAAQLSANCGFSAQRMDVLEVYDNFTPIILYALEGLGYCDRGTAWQWVADGKTMPGGSFPLNTSGGQTSESYMQGWGLIIELIRQLRGESHNQVRDCDIGQYVCVSTVVASLVMSRDE
jgi:acetyl-CoA acetyltransferase